MKCNRYSVKKKWAKRITLFRCSTYANRCSSSQSILKCLCKVKMDLYNVVKLLGSGTFGTVHLCEKKHNSQQNVVIKQINLEFSGGSLATAQNEVDLLKSLHHPNIIEYFDSFIKNGSFHIVMEFATKGTLTQFIMERRPKKFSPQIVMNIFCQILMGLNQIHGKNVIHRDLKCDNIFLTGLERDVVKIGDFGISKKLINNKSANTMIGTCNYVAPEVCDGKPYNIKSDIWSLGCILYELCAMEKMFDGTLSNVVMSIASGRRKCIDVRFYGLQIEQLIGLMVKMEPENRPTTEKLMCLPDVFPSLHILGANLGCNIHNDK